MIKKDHLYVNMYIEKAIKSFIWMGDKSMHAFKWSIILLMLFFNNAAFAEKTDTALTGKHAVSLVQKQKIPIFTEDKSSIMLTKDQPQFIIRLKANPTTGYIWFLREYDSALIIPLKHEYQAPNKKLPGAPSYDDWTFSVKPTGFIVPQVTQIRFIYIRPWEAQGTAGKQVVFRIATQ
jgi:inhibitor of cysteine peptidase